MGVRIGLLSDTHIPESRNALWPQVYDAFQDVDYIFHGGDIHELWLLDTLEQIAPVFAAGGNGEDGSGRRQGQPEDALMKYAWTLEMEGVYGDTHIELFKEVNGILCVNPDSPTYPHNYNTQYGTIGFLELDNGEANASVWQITDDGIEPFNWNAIPPWQRRK